MTTVGLGLLLGGGIGSIQGCNGDTPGGPLGDLAEQCGLDINCEAGGVLEGNASVSGIASIDSFFGAVIDVNAKIGEVEGTIRTELDAIAVSVGLEPGAAGAEIRGAIEARISGAVSGGLSIQAEPARCEASVEVVASAAAECDASVDPGSVSFACEGSCEVEAGVAVDCGAEAELRCTAQAPSVECSGMCTGTCSASGGVACEGTCKGGCEGTCSVENADGTCNGRCEGGACTGSCELDVAASCEGNCEGTCDYVAPEGGCEATAQARCEAQAGGSVECSAGCEGSAEPPSVSAECEASVEAKASASVQCTPPSLAITWEWSAELQGDLDAQAEFRGWINGFRGHFAAILAARAQADLLVEAGQGLVDAAGVAVMDAATDLQGEASLKASIGAACAIQELPIAGQVIGDAVGRLQGSVSAAVEVSAAVGG
ncbi:hypothetical protein [Paraliomyxa miuraensis]|uniref:hypothetical protein n=1 Tax=Paraliomyxa miuraensis TaxID=376150 RepID=UPI002256F8C3|nr:hypothetical protein [Paraliomyxa miuraensis]MCX4242739.1 hypothetical protein [Paraliomyxa miuraensis]